MNQTNPKVSVIIPVYNTELYLRECLDSVVKQTLRDIEIICVNDGSTDDSPAILEEYRQADPRVTVISQANGGLSAARNSGIRCAHGKYIYFLDSDDILELDALKKTSQLAEEAELDAVLFGTEPFFESEELRKTFFVVYRNCKEMSEVVTGVEYLRRSHEDKTYSPAVWHAVWRHSLLLENGIFFKEGIIHEDHLFTFQCCMEAKRVVQIPDIFYRRRVRENSIMTRPKSAKNVMGCFICAKEILAYSLGGPYEPEKEHEIARAYSEIIQVARSYYRVLSAEERANIVFSEEMANMLFRQLVVSEEELRQTRNKLDEIEAGLRKAKYDLDCVHASVSFRVGRGITWLPRKLRGGVRCYQEHGAAYTARRLMEHLSGKA